MDIVDRLRLEYPVLQAGLGGGLAGADLAGAVSSAGGLGTLGIMPAERLASEIRRVRELAPGRPVAVNLLMPFTRPAHVRVCIEAGVDGVVLFFGFSRRIVAALREGGIFVIHQVGDSAEAHRAVTDGADALIAQGIEAGGHLVAKDPLAEALPSIREVAGSKPVLAAGGIVDANGARAALDAGADAVVCGTRFLLTDECDAHGEYKRRVLGAQQTIVTELFGFGWPARHRVVPNAATWRWCRTQDAGSALVRALNRPTGRLGRLLPLQSMEVMAKAQHPLVPLLSPAPLLRGMPQRSVEATALYAGSRARDIHRVVSAAAAVRELAGVASPS